VAGFGDSRHAAKKSDGGFLIIHGRTSTCGVSLENTHPMLSPNAALVHNGVVHSKTHRNQSTTCDSELILSAYTKGGIKEVAESIAGYYAFMLLQKIRHARALTVARDFTASLHAGETDNGFAFATTPRLLAVAKARNLGPVKGGQCISFRSAKAFTITEFSPLKEAVTDSGFEDMADLAFGRATATPPPRKFSNYAEFEKSLR
jgi:asparagine synthetase B (glutamine-hydrolysing)